MAASKRSSVRPVERSNRSSVPKSGGKPVARASVAGSKPAGRAPAKAQRQPPKAVPTVQRRLDTLVPYPSDRYPAINPTVLASAFGRAAKDDQWQRVSWDPKRQKWEVPSATDPGRSYLVWRRRGRKGPLPFYVALECNCMAEQSGSYIVCWHKCAVKMWLDEWFHSGAFTTPPDEVPDEDFEP